MGTANLRVSIEHVCSAASAVGTHTLLCKTQRMMRYVGGATQPAPG
jgi:hypothetical protein